MQISRSIRWLSLSACIPMLVGGCGANNGMQRTAGMAEQSVNHIVGQQAPTNASQKLPVQLVQFDDKAKTVRVVITTLPVDERNGPVGHTRSFTEYRQAPMLIAMPTGWTIHAVVPDKEPWQIHLASQAEEKHQIRPRNASHHAQLTGRYNADYQLTVSEMGGPARVLDRIHVSSAIKTPMVSTHHSS